MHTYFALFAVVILVFGHPGAFQFLEEPCGGGLNTNKIANGHNAGEEAAAWMAAISNATHFLCGGTLIHKRFVLTAAHCINHKNILFVKLGAYRKSQPTAQYDVEKKMVHQLHNEFSRGNDIGLLKLSGSVVYNEFIYPICIIMMKTIKSLVRAAPKFAAFGWGQNGKGQENEILQTITLNNLNPNGCNKTLYVVVSSEQICAGVDNGDTCLGDSGGPLTTRVNVNKTKYREVQVGIVSFGNSDCNGPGVYTDVTSHMDWIQETINKEIVEESIPEEPLRFDNVQDMWLYRECGGDTIASNLRANIFGTTFSTQGVLITSRFVLTNARYLRENVASLYVIVMGIESSYGEYGVDAVFEHQKFSDEKYDIALLRLSRSVRHTEGLKPICMLSNLQIQQRGELNLPLTIFDYVRIQEPVKIYAVLVESIGFLECSRIIQKEVETDEICVKTESLSHSHRFGNPGDILGKRIMGSEKEWFVLFGIVSYSHNGWHVVTNIMRHTKWIANTVDLNNLSN
uniref:Testisin n=1 Tax=Drosophila rhopaloa TaxID=1041015 RepID=A0A6P4F629_DRORH